MTLGGGGPPFPTQPQWVSLASENRLGPHRRRTGCQRNATAVATTIPKAIGCCQSMWKTVVSQELKSNLVIV